MEKISIIVPVYNTEKYLKNCLNSLINQTYKNLEIICVNDDSEDNSLKILEEYSKKDERIKVINQEKKGVSAARNAGIDISGGDYIMFVDSDDSLELNSCEVLTETFKKNKQADIILFQYNEIKNNKKTKKKYFVPFKDISEITANPFFVFNIIKTDFIKKNKIYFPINIDKAEDDIFFIRMLNCSPDIFILDEYLYNYNKMRENSLSHSDGMRYVNSYKKEHIDNFLVSLFSQEDNNSEKEHLKKCLYDRYFLKILGFWSDVYFTKDKKKFIQIADEMSEGQKELNITKQDVKQMRAYSYYKKYKIMSFLHLGSFYFYFIRPFLRKQ